MRYICSGNTRLYFKKRKTQLSLKVAELLDFKCVSGASAQKITGEKRIFCSKRWVKWVFNGSLIENIVSYDSNFSRNIFVEDIVLTLCLAKVQKSPFFLDLWVTIYIKASLYWFIVTHTTVTHTLFYYMESELFFYAFLSICSEL